jgi:hypothetical protein
MFAFLLEGFSYVGSFLSKDQWYMLLRIACFQIAFVAFAVVCLKSLRSGTKDYSLAATLLALSTIVSFNYAWEDTTDALDLFALCMGVFASLSNRYILAIILAVLFAANRESAAFIGVIWACLSDPTTGMKRRVLEGTAICASSYLCALFLRMYFAGSGDIGNWITPLANARMAFDAIMTFSPLRWLMLLVSIITALSINIDLNEITARRFVVLAGLFTAAALCFGHINEIRVFLPCFLMLAFAIAAGHQTGSGDVNLTTTHRQQRYPL